MTIELKRSQEEALAAAKFAFAGELAARVAHEVWTPLSVMRSSAQTLADANSRRIADNAELVSSHLVFRSEGVLARWRACRRVSSRSSSMSFARGRSRLDVALEGGSR
jgi:phosphoglycerate-specific signal transduction histidine kinase